MSDEEEMKGEAKMKTDVYGLSDLLYPALAAMNASSSAGPRDP